MPTDVPHQPSGMAALTDAELEALSLHGEDAETAAEASDRLTYRRRERVVWDVAPEGKTLTGADAWEDGTTEDEYVAERREHRAEQERFLAERDRLAAAAGIPLDECGAVGRAGGEVQVYRLPKSAREPHAHAGYRAAATPGIVSRSRDRGSSRRSRRSTRRCVAAASGSSRGDPDPPGDEPPGPLVAAAGRGDDSDTPQVTIPPGWTPFQTAWFVARLLLPESRLLWHLAALSERRADHLAFRSDGRAA
jgi:hypothetical protein